MTQLISLYKLNNKKFINAVMDILPSNIFLRMLIVLIFIAMPIGAMIIQFILYAEVYNLFGLYEMVFIQYGFTELICFIISLMMISSKLVYYKNYELFAAFPIKNRTIIFNNLIEILFPLLFIQLFVYFPSIMSLFYINKLSIMAVITKLVYTLLITVYIFLLLSIITGVLVWLKRKYKKYLAVILVIAIAAVLKGVAGAINSFEKLSLPEGGYFKDTLTYLMEVGKSAFIVNNTISRMTLSHSVTLNISFMLILIILCFIGLKFVTAIFYNIIFVIVPDNAENKKKLKQNKKKSGSVDSLLLQRELWIIRTEPHFLTNAVMEMFLAPLLMVIALSILKVGSAYREDIQYAVEAINRFNFRNEMLVLLILIIVNMQSSYLTPVSREGKYFWHSRVLPVSYRQQYLAKTAFAFLSGVISASVTFFIIICENIVKIDTPFLIYMYMISGELVIVSFCSSRDYKKPYLDWDEPRKATNNNINVLFGMLRVFIVLFLTILLLSAAEICGSYKTLCLMAAIIILLLVAAAIINKRCNVIHKNYEDIAL